VSPLKIWAPDPVLDQIRRHLFNNQPWPDFSSFRIGDFPVIEYCSCNPGEETTLPGLRIRCVQTSHPVYSVGYLVSASQGSFLYSGDTGPTDDLWALARSAENLRAVFVETAFPNRLQEIALEFGHLTQALLGDELAKLGRPDVAVNIMHVKSVYQAEISRELLALERSCTILAGGERFIF